MKTCLGLSAPVSLPGSEDSQGHAGLGCEDEGWVGSLRTFTATAASRLGFW